MIRILAGLPGLVGAVAVSVGARQAIAAFDYSDSQSLLDELSGGIVPIAIGLALILSAIAIARRSRLGYLIGVLGAFGVIGLSILFIAQSIPHLNDGPWNLYGVAIGAAVVIILVSAGYAALLSRARKSFTATWGHEDRRLVVGLAIVLVTWFGLTVTGRAVQKQGAEAIGIGAAQGQALAAGTDFEVRVIDATTDPVTNLVRQLTLEVTLRNAPVHELDGSPMLCLTDEVTSADIGKPGTLCFGAPDPGRPVDAVWNDSAATSEGTTVRVELERGLGPCAYLPGRWTASFGFSQLVEGAERFWKQASFTVVAGGAGSTAQPGGPWARASCLRVDDLGASCLRR